jgi:hypothetical protein
MMSSDFDAEDWVGRLLLRPVKPVADRGFTSRIEDALPRRRAPYRWIAPAALLLGVFAGGALSGGRLLRALETFLASAPARPLASFADDIGTNASCTLALVAIWAVSAWALFDRGARD